MAEHVKYVKDLNMKTITVCHGYMSEDPKKVVMNDEEGFRNLVEVVHDSSKCGMFENGIVMLGHLVFMRIISWCRNESDCRHTHRFPEYIQQSLQIQCGLQREPISLLYVSMAGKCYCVGGE